MKHRVLLGGYSSEVPPLPIPNREVKLTNADGTAYLGGRVGSRLFKRRPNENSIFSFLFAEVSAAPYLKGDLAVREYYPNRLSSLRHTIIPLQIKN